MNSTEYEEDLLDLIKELSTSDHLSMTDGDCKLIRYYVHSDGCSRVPDLYVSECYKHDFYYRTHHDFEGKLITRAEADRRFRLGIQHKSGCGVFNLLSWWRWAAVRLWASGAWYKKENCHG